jgi:hypothetical protein
MASITQRVLTATISLAAGDNGKQPTFAGTGGANEVTLSGFRMSAHLTNAGGPSSGTMSLTIFGMTDTQMKQLSTLGMQVNLVPKNPITLKAAGSVVFVGYILAAYADYNASPAVAFHIEAHTLAGVATAPAKPLSFQGSVDVSTIMSGLAASMGLQFENNGVTTKLNNQYFSGSLKTQAITCVRNAGIEWNSGQLGTLAIWPKNGSRGGQVPVIAPPPEGGMFGYPTYTAYGIMLRNLFNPAIGFGAMVEVRSSVLTTGKWKVYGLNHDLDCEVPGGKWESTILAYNPKFPTPVV